MAKEKKPRGLSVKQRRFVEAYDGNATAAAIAAGYSPKNARNTGARMLTKANIRGAVLGQIRRAARDFKIISLSAL